MKTVVIRECSNIKLDSSYELNLDTFNPKDCTGCWSCWLKTPGKCIFRDLDQFHRKYLEADKVIIFSQIKKGFISGKMKTIIDRLICHYLPYIEISKEGSNHLARYNKYPDIEFYYEGNFSMKNGKQILEDYIIRTFTQYRSKNIMVKDINTWGATK
ncbi:flavodoxin family protein [Vallitalea guaymasensis]|uniref:flavodoxin family protein n=2 Tax=Vallitalea guaymasensis TaxID=1185412 RepID=UPI00272D3B08|nr:flavodoxin family protein [Vallitalea guaymasensis]